MHVPCVIALFLTSAWTHEIIFQGSCDQKSVPCQDACIDLEDSTFECGCNTGKILQPDGISCENADSKIRIVDPTTKSPRKRAATEDPKSFSSFLSNSYQPLGFGSDYSFVSFSVPDSAYLETNISLELKPHAQFQNGLLFFGGQRYGRDFISVSLQNGNVVLRFDCGEGTAEEIVSGPLEPGIWHKIQISRKYCSYSEIHLDKPQRFLTDQPTLITYKGISMSPLLYLGGVPENLHKTVLSKAGFSESFRGCVSKLQVNEEILFDVTKRINKAKELSNVEICTTQTASTVTVQNVQNISGSSSVPLKSPHFAGDSFIKHRGLVSVQDYLTLEFHIKPTESSGLLFYAGNSNLESYVIVFLKNSFVYFQFDLGEGASVLRSELPVSLRSWHKVEVWRSGRGGLLKIDNQDWVEGSSPGGFSRMEKSRFIYFGGAPLDVLPVSIRFLSNTGFHGCMKKIFVNQKSISSRFAVSLNNVRECNSNPCVPNPCNTGNCTLYHDEFMCLCLFPFSGTNCEKKIESRINAMGFRGNGYLQFKQHEIMKHITGETLDLSLRFRLSEAATSTEDKEQILVFAGKETKGGDFMSLSVTPGRKVKATIDLGSGPVSLTHDSSSVKDNQWHTVTMRRSGRRLTVLFDNHIPETTVAPSGSLQFNVYEALFFGGYFPKHGVFPNSGLHGCISEMTLGQNFRIDHLQQASLAVNIHHCRGA